MIFDLFAQIFSGITGVAAQTTAQTTTPPAHSANTLGNLFQFDADGGAGWASSAFGEPPEWAPWHPNFDEFANYGPDGNVSGGIGVTPQRLGYSGPPDTMSRGNGQTSQTQPPTSITGGSPSSSSSSSPGLRDKGISTSVTPEVDNPPNLVKGPELVREGQAPGHSKYVPDAVEVNTPNVQQKITTLTAPTLVEEPQNVTRGIPVREQRPTAPTLVRGPQQVTRSIPLPEQNPISTDSQTRGDNNSATPAGNNETISAQPTVTSPGTPGSHPELPAHLDVNNPTSTQQDVPPLPERAQRTPPPLPERAQRTPPPIPTKAPPRAAQAPRATPETIKPAPIGELKPTRNFSYLSNRTRGAPLSANNVKGIVAHDASGKVRGFTSAPPNTRAYHVTFDEKGFYHQRPLDKTGGHAKGGLLTNRNSIGLAYHGFEGDKLSKASIRNGAKAVLFIEKQLGRELKLYRHPEIQGGKLGGKAKNAAEASWAKAVAAEVQRMKTAEMKFAEQ